MKMTPRNFGDNQPSLEEVERLGGAVIVSYSDLFDESKHLSKSIEVLILITGRHCDIHH